MFATCLSSASMPVPGPSSVVTTKLFFCISLTRGLSILLVFLKNQLLVLLILTLYLFSISVVFALYYFILLSLSLTCYSFLNPWNRTLIYAFQGHLPLSMAVAFWLLSVVRLNQRPCFTFMWTWGLEESSSSIKYRCSECILLKTKSFSVRLVRLRWLAVYVGKLINLKWN